MTKLQKSKKGFTLTELAIVIAIIAILIAVLVPTFISLINKAQQSSDSQLVKNLNTALTTEEAIDGKADTMSDALAIAAENGYNVDKLTPSSTGDIVWDQESNRFLLIDEDGEIYYKDDATSEDVLDTQYQLWYIATSADDVAEGKYSYYLDYAPTETVKATYGIDAGDNKDVDVELTNTAAAKTGDSGNVALAAKKLTASTTSTTPAIKINLNGGSLTVSSDNISVEIYGTVSGNVYLAKGDVEITSTATVSVVVVTSTSVSITNSSTVTVSVVSGNSSVSVTAITASGCDTTDTTTYDTTTLSYFAGGLGTESSPYIINSIDNWLNFRNKGYADDGLYWSVTCDLDFSGLESTDSKGTTTYTYVDITTFTGTIDFNGNNVSGIKLGNCENIYSNAYGGLFYNVIGESTISNLCYEIKNLGSDIAVRPVHYVGYNKNNINVTLSNVTVTGEVVYTDNNASTFVFALYGDNTNLAYKNCTNYANISNNGMTGIFIGQIMQYTGWHISFENCVNYGNIQSTNNFASMLISNSCSFSNNSISSSQVSDYVTVTNCVNYGNIYGATNANLLCGSSDYETIASKLDIVNLQSGICTKMTVNALSSTNNVFDFSNVISSADHYTLSFSAFLTSSDGKKWGTYILYEYTFDSYSDLSATTVYAYEFKDFSTNYSATNVGETDLCTTTISGTTYYVVNYVTEHGHYYLNGGSVSVNLCAYDADNSLLSVYATTLAFAK